MILLDGATITIRQENGEFEARAIVGYHGRGATTGSVIESIGWAVLLAAGYTEAQLLEELRKEHDAETHGNRNHHHPTDRQAGPGQVSKR